MPSNAGQMMDPSIDALMSGVESLGLKQEEKSQSEHPSTLAGFLHEIETKRPPPQMNADGSFVMAGPRKRQLPIERTLSTAKPDKKFSLPVSTVVPVHGSSNQPKPAARPTLGESPKNPFYHSKLKYPDAIKYIASILSAATKACQNWLNASEEDHLSHALNKSGPMTVAPRIARDLGHIREFLQYGRGPWRLTWLPDNFFVDMEELLTRLQAALDDPDQSVHVREQLEAPVEQVKDRFASIKSARLWERCKSRWEGRNKRKYDDDDDDDGETEAEQVGEEEEQVEHDVEADSRTDKTKKTAPGNGTMATFGPVTSTVDITFGGRCAFTGEKGPA